MLYELTQGEPLSRRGVGQHQMWKARNTTSSNIRDNSHEAGLGAMGYGYPAAWERKVARPDKQVVDIDGDGSFLMNVQELATAHIERSRPKPSFRTISTLGWWCNGRQVYEGTAGTHFWAIRTIGNRFIRITSHGQKLQRAVRAGDVPKDMRAALQRMLDSDQPYLLDVIVPYTEHVLPFIPAGRTVADMIWKA